MSPKKKEIQLGQLLVKKRFCTLKDVNRALVKQQQLRGESRSTPLGVLLLEGGLLEEEQLKEALFELGVLRLYCPACQIAYSPPSYFVGGENLCPQCQGETCLDNRLDERDPPPVEATADPSSRYSSVSALQQGPSAELSEDAHDAFLGRVLGGCEIESKIAHGGMGVVYKATQLNLGRTVAVKVLAEDLASDESFVRRFLQEARAAAQLNHANVVHINDVGQYHGIYYFVMEYIDGRNLREVLNERNKLSIREAMQVALQVCHALKHAHSRGIIHRDIKPENIMLTRDGVVKLADLGLAKRVEVETTDGITHAGSVLGTPFYMAPEQAKDFSKVDGRSDIYSLGVTIYRAIAGEVPFQGRSPLEVMIRAVEGRKTPLRDLEPDIPACVEEVVERMMHRLPEERYQTVEEVARAIEQVLSRIPETETVA